MAYRLSPNNPIAIRRAGACAIALCLLVIAAAFCTPRAWADDAPTANSAATATAQARTVKVGYFENGGYMYKNDDGSYGGFDVEYLYTVAGYAGWNIQFVEYKSVSECLSALSDGAIDMQTSLAKTSERESLYLFSNQEMGQSHISVMTRSDDDRFSPGESSALADAKTAVLKGSIASTMYSNWCTQNGLTPHIVEFDNTAQRDQALADGTVDAIAAGSTIEGTQVIAQFQSTALYCAFNSAKSDLKSQYDRAVMRLGFDDPTFTSDLRLKYFPLSKNTSPAFSAAEKSYIQSHPIIRVAMLKSDEPLSTQGSDGSVSGVIPDYYAHLADIIGVTFEGVCFSTRDEEYRALSEGSVDMIGTIQDDVFTANANGFILSSRYLQTDLNEITRSGTEQVATAAVPSCSIATATQIVEAENRSIELIAYPNSTESFEALKAGKVDAVICCQTSATWFLNRSRSSDYFVSVFGNEQWTACAGLPATTDGNVLRSIMNKTIAVDNDYINQIITSDTLRSMDDLGTILDRIPLGVIAAIAILFMILAVILVFALVVIVRRRKRESQLARQRAEADRREAQLEAESRANRMRADFFSTISHDMRTPLNGIAGFTDLALKSDDPAQIDDYLAKIRASSTLLRDLVSDTLVMSRIESGKLQLDLQPQSAREMFEATCLPNRAIAREKGVDFIVDDDDAEDCIIMADRTKVQKIFLNLVSNAVKFTPTGGTVELVLSTRRAGSGIYETRTVVKDTGIGISEDFLPHIFEPFAQERFEDAGTVGTGLGLAIAKRLVDSLGGTIEVASTKGRGTAFTVSLSFDEASDEDKRKFQAERSRASASTDGDVVGHLAGKRALICEDNALNLEIAKTMLEHLGMEVDTAGNGEEGVRAFEASAIGEIDVILLDLRMPVMDGFRSAEEIRSLERADARTVPMIAVSADCSPADVERCLAVGMNGHVSKPIGGEELAETLAKVIPA